MPLSLHTTHISSDLQAGGTFTPEQARKITQAIMDAHNATDPVTNASLDVKLKEMELRLVKWMASLVGLGVAILALLIEF